MTSFVRSLDKLKPLYFHWRSAYGHQTWKDGNLSWWAPTHKVTKTINTWSCKVSWQSKTIISPLPQLLWLPNLADWWFTLRSSYQFIDMTFYSRGLVKSRGKLKTLYLCYHKLGKVLTNHEELSFKKFHDPSTTWFCEVTGQIKYYMAWLWPTMRGLHP